MHIRKYSKNEHSQVASGDALNIIIPIGGIGSRFSKEGYRYPKPLINIVGRPMILRLIDNLSLIPGDTLWMAANEEIDDEFRLGQLVMKTFPKLDFKFLRLKHQTRGASETLYVITQSMTEQHLTRRTISLDCDTIYWADILTQVRNLPLRHGAVFYFSDEGLKPIFSYIKTDAKQNGLIVDIQEKKAISNKANTGAYVFVSGEKLQEWAAKSIDANAKKLNVAEYYTSQLIGMMIFEGKLPFLGLPIGMKDFSCVGTPEQLQDLLLQLRIEGKENQVQKRRFCFDLDMTLVGVPAVAGDYTTCPPIWKNIKLVQQLHKAGHYIIIQTARRMRTHSGNVGAILKDVGMLTFDQLAKYQIPYDDLHFGKPWADVYIDDLAVNANLDTEREIGWLLDSTDSILPSTAASPTKPRSVLAARDFNTVQFVGSKVLKSSKSEAILGELYFYSHMPSRLASIFPTIFAVDYLEETKTYTLEMEYRLGLTFSHMLVGRSITKGRLLTMLAGLHKIHTTIPSLEQQQIEISPALAEKFEEHSIEVTGAPNLYANYGTKLRSRYFANKERYDTLGPDAAKYFERLNEFLDTYEAEEKGVRTQIIHGDPVFSNVILSPDESTASFIDVRCQLSSTLTTEGDLHYDLAKVLQSLMGYDHILFLSLDALPSSSSPLLEEADEKILENLRGIFWEWVEGKYGLGVHRKTLLRITASLVFSLIPLHKEELGGVFLRLCGKTLELASGSGAGTSHTSMGHSLL
ncbi:nucleotide-diphospho-sugar transferase [Mollisia scopiformis]|uniref:Mannose-1-phosphate guanyltransferase n=1 Tax=Mollisia scopiformis TaxID=149040 RepID=A0A132BA27_MOLSC|nr:nucleotide-diphospho-sugar transferase [Mollisia scopiformis]KUJ08724.1 nucleotide-diphospho-sugar transferase [Mollisia scopiformis]